MFSTTPSGVNLSHDGGVREYGMAEADIPLPLLWRRPMIAAGWMIEGAFLKGGCWLEADQRLMCGLGALD